MKSTGDGMTVKELKAVLELMDDDAKVSICVNEPAGWMCPDGCVVDVESVCMGIDMHQGEVFVVPKYRLDIHDIEEWSGDGKKQKGTVSSDMAEGVQKEKDSNADLLWLRNHISILEREVKRREEGIDRLCQILGTTHDQICDPLVTTLFGCPFLSPRKIEKWLVTRNMINDGESTRDSVERCYGKEVADLAESLI